MTVIVLFWLLRVTNVSDHGLKYLSESLICFCFSFSTSHKCRSVLSPNLGETKITRSILYMKFTWVYAIYAFYPVFGALLSCSYTTSETFAESNKKWTFQLLVSPKNKNSLLMTIFLILKPPCKNCSNKKIKGFQKIGR